MTIYATFQAFYITFNTVNFYIYIVNSCSVISNVCSVVCNVCSIFSDTFTIVSNCHYVSLNVCSIRSDVSSIIFYFTIDISNLIFNIIDYSRGFTYLTFQFINSFCININICSVICNSYFVVANEFTIFKSNCASYVDVFSVLIDFSSKIFQVAFNAINFYIYIVDCCYIVSNISSVISNICSINFNTIFYCCNTCRVIYNVVL